MKYYVLHDSGACEVVRIYRTMEEGIVAALQRARFLRYNCIGFEYDDEITVIEYKSTEEDWGYSKGALTIEAADLD